MWTIQEVVMVSIERVFLIAGEEKIPYLQLSAGIKELESSEELQMAVSYPLILKHFFARHIDPCTRSRAPSPTKEPDCPSAACVLEEVRVRQSSEPRDKIYALYWICRDLFPKFPVPDYSKTVAQVYTEATTMAIMQDENLDILYMAPSQTTVLDTLLFGQRPYGLPSWVPDFSQPSDFRYSTTNMDFEASGNSRPQYSFLCDGNVLRVSGIIVDNLQEVGGRIPLMEEFDNRMLVWYWGAFTEAAQWTFMGDVQES
jgi:hypothetical protein